LMAIPGAAVSDERERLQEIPGMVPPLWDPAGGCGFCPRLDGGSDLCRHERPELVEVAPDHFVRCWASRAGSVSRPQ
jgi:peptide/nickel transport system ATP-binding protein